MIQNLKSEEIVNKSSITCLFQHTFLQTAYENSSLWFYHSTFPSVRWGIILRFISVTPIVKGLTSHTYQLTLVLTQSLTSTVVRQIIVHIATFSSTLTAFKAASLAGWGWLWHQSYKDQSRCQLTKEMARFWNFPIAIMVWVQLRIKVRSWVEKISYLQLFLHFE